MKTKILTLVAILFAANFTKAQETWNKEHVTKLIKHVQKNGTLSEGSSYMLLPNGNSVKIMLGKRDTVIGIPYGKVGNQTMFQFLTGEKTTFKGNILYMSPTIASEENYQELISYTHDFLRKFAEELPLPPKGLFEGNEPLTKKFIEFRNFITQQPDMVIHHMTDDGDDMKTKEFVRYSEIIGLVYLHYDGKLGKTSMTFRADMPISEGEDQNGKRVDLELLDQILSVR